MTQPENEIQSVLDQLALLEPSSADAPRPAAQTLAHIRKRREPGTHKDPLTYLRRVLTASSYRVAFASVLLVMLFGLAFSFPTVRAAASEFLGLFRVQKFAAISISADQIAILERVAREGLVPGEFEIISESAGVTPADSIGEASAITGLAVRSLAALGEPVEVYVTGGSTGRLTIDLEGSRAILEATGVDPGLLPDTLDGKQVEVSVFAGVEQRWQNGTWLLQAESPLVEYPAEMDPAVLGQALLQVLGMSEEESSRLAQDIDWTSTLLLPIPRDFATFNEVIVDGVSGLALASLDGEHGVIMWQTDGVVYALNGAGSTAELVSLANSLQ
jgi:hypothetical protein